MESLDSSAAGLTRLLSVYDRASLSPELASQANAIKKEIRYEEVLPELSSIIADCQEGARRIRDIVLNLRTFSRLDEAEATQIDINASIESTIRILSQYYNSDYIALKREYRPLPLMNCFAGQLNQVWMNLLMNAAQAIGRGPGEVRIETGVKDKMVFVKISDTGSGIKPEDMGKIFEPFFTGTGFVDQLRHHHQPRRDHHGCQHPWPRDDIYNADPPSCAAPPNRRAGSIRSPKGE